MKYIIQQNSTMDKVHSAVEFVYGFDNDRLTEKQEDAKEFDSYDEASEIAAKLFNEIVENRTSLGYWGISFYVLEIDEEVGEIDNSLIESKTW